MNATLTATPLPAKELAPRRRKGAFVGVAEQLARLLPVGARVKVEWQHAALGKGSDLFGAGDPPQGALRLPWAGPEGMALCVVFSSPQPMSCLLYTSGC